MSKHFEVVDENAETDQSQNKFNLIVDALPHNDEGIDAVGCARLIGSSIKSAIEGQPWYENDDELKFLSTLAASLVNQDNPKKKIMWTILQSSGIGDKIFGFLAQIAQEL